jgi:3-oxoadipate enol-lactonase
MQILDVAVPGGHLHALDEGNGPPLVLLHEGIVDLRAWDGLVPLLLAAGFRTIRYDRRGHGRSETKDVEYSNRADLVAILDALGLERAIVVAGSAGGQIAIDTAIEHPGRIDGIVALGAGLGGYEIDLRPEEVAVFESMAELEEGAVPDPDAIADLDVRVWVDGIGQPADRVPAEVREAVRAMDRALWQPGRVRGRPVPHPPPAAERLDELRCPVLAVAGELDVTEVIATARHLEASAPDARAVIVPGVAHMIALERPGLVADLVVGFVRGLG